MHNNRLINHISNKHYTTVLQNHFNKKKLKLTTDGDFDLNFRNADIESRVCCAGYGRGALFIIGLVQTVQ